MNFNIMKAIILIACLNIVLYAGGIRVIENSTLDSFIDLNAYENNDTVKASESFKGSVPENFENTGESSSLTFIDTLGAITGFLVFIINIIFTPIGLFATLPPIAGLMVGAPLLIAAVISLIYFIRSGR